MEKLFNKTQELRNFCKDIGYKIAFLNYECKCGNGVTVFESKARKPLFNISEDDNRSIIELAQEVGKRIKELDIGDIEEHKMTLEDLRISRNVINRKISILKKESLNN